MRVIRIGKTTGGSAVSGVVPGCTAALCVFPSGRGGNLAAAGGYDKGNFGAQRGK